MQSNSDSISVLGWIKRLAANEVQQLKHEFIDRGELFIAVCNLSYAVDLIPKGIPTDDVEKEAKQIDDIFALVGGTATKAKQLLRKKMIPGEKQWPKGRVMMQISPHVRNILAHAEELASIDENYRSEEKAIYYLAAILEDPGEIIASVLEEMNIDLEKFRSIVLEAIAEAREHSAEKQRKASAPLPGGTVQIGFFFDSNLITVKEKKANCFIATAVYGSPYAPEVKLLKEFRDNLILSNTLGRLAVAIYYYFSPWIARLIAKSRRAKFLTRLIIVKPALSIARICLRYSKRT